MSWMLILLFVTPGGVQMATATVPAYSYQQCQKNYEAAKQHWGSMVRGGQCLPISHSAESER